MFNKIKAIKDIRTQAKTMQSELELIEEQGRAAHGKVVVSINGNQKILSVQIDDDLMKDKEKLQEAIKEATNEAIKNVQKKMAVKMKEMGGLDMLKNLNM
ncbi:MAG: hypothetical protein UU08_C0028G0004 [Candidatus Uhrbacteria bacterium GW2011_GWE2_40_58]|nr:MAG: hypothetical protein UT94_C0038G0004 [Candidatus Uhrbacteria bacterium GW2011_GWF2_40_263]KKR67072.1 MAG: hypothetical protein UU08_C0028G0004 [Candidatus Uhrbacteria bacterium GW2011_GWE2_40_58]OGL93987.1 MAG: nucleoid-associated protein, YbaB/EbfC family [Candidatus Uhrbacteria bacterium RIFOXYA2_FULL_40_9]OGL97819.1 MAG: nucleoid-associated protein, YbaB/EbfC family [Candidatus Uhrbacteria bacterium RIFOXYB2_FULL_41_18]HBK35236.1 nucleoid-associated protein, YbaB/EbfC family [Candida